MTKEPKPMTRKQQNAMHLWFQMLADELNLAGLDQRKVLKQSVKIPWDKSSVKERLYKPILEAYKGKKSTTDMTTKEIEEMLDILTRHLGKKFGVSCDFPSVETLMQNEESKKF